MIFDMVKELPTYALTRKMGTCEKNDTTFQSAPLSSIVSYRIKSKHQEYLNFWYN